MGRPGPQIKEDAQSSYREGNPGSMTEYIITPIRRESKAEEILRQSSRFRGTDPALRRSRFSFLQEIRKTDEKNTIGCCCKSGAKIRKIKL